MLIYLLQINIIYIWIWVRFKWFIKIWIFICI